jgi:hypothetical protein
MENVISSKRNRKQTLRYEDETRLHTEKCIYDRNFNGNVLGNRSETKPRIKVQKKHYSQKTGDTFYSKN